MTPQEFKSWFEGFTEAMSGTPTKAQWVRIKERVAEIDGKPVTERILIDHYYQRYWQYCNIPVQMPVYWNATNGITTNTVTFSSNAFDGCIAMNALGRAESISLTS